MRVKITWEDSYTEQSGEVMSNCPSLSSLLRLFKHALICMTYSQAEGAVLQLMDNKDPDRVYSDSEEWD